MDACLSHMTALHWLLRNFNLRSRGDRPSRASALPSHAPDTEEAQDIYRAIGGSLPQDADGAYPKLDVLVSRRGGRRMSSCVRSHLCSAKLPAGSFVPMGIRGFDLWITSPELTFLQLAAELDVVAAAYVGMALCSSFRIDSFDTSGVVRRRAPDEPLTSVKRIAAYLRRAAGVRGVERASRARARARRGAVAT
ncbi:hypothetical protein [Thermophilibacter sp.]